MQGAAALHSDVEADRGRHIDGDRAAGANRYVVGVGQRPKERSDFFQELAGTADA